ncbi:hypothetical protein DDE82_007021 [Stemphylium lycopersici]|nr:hypothetical protein DDE82_007021 [Stemphylium lycopersici]
MSFSPISRAVMSDESRPSDFKDLIEAAVILTADSSCFLEKSAPFSNRDGGVSPQLEAKRNLDEELNNVAKALLRRHRDLDTHYGWVLASDRACVERVIQEYCRVGRRTEEWFEEMLERLGAVLLWKDRDTDTE